MCSVLCFSASIASVRDVLAMWLRAKCQSEGVSKKQSP